MKKNGISVGGAYFTLFPIGREFLKTHRVGPLGLNGFLTLVNCFEFSTTLRNRPLYCVGDGGRGEGGGVVLELFRKYLDIGFGFKSPIFWFIVSSKELFRKYLDIGFGFKSPIFGFIVSSKGRYMTSKIEIFSRKSRRISEI